MAEEQAPGMVAAEAPQTDQERTGALVGRYLT